ncbi:DUF6624 domain-containing protein [Streptomyces venezuelae]|uniref:DUF6624 domain-containing protein n=1 Tax=Streptomyces venezuelae TaxID=54571 RepID=UPI00364DB077
MTTAEAQRPDLARELIARAAQSAAHRAKRVRNQLDAVHVGQGRHAEHANTKILGRILAEHDWPGHRLVGPDAARAAWSIALHSDDGLAFQRAAITRSGRAVEAGDAPVKHWVHLHDRVLVTSGCDQEYGTQFLLRVDGIELCPLRDPASVDARRITVGLSPIAAALEAVRRRYTPGRPNGEAPTVVLAEAA